MGTVYYDTEEIGTFSPQTQGASGEVLFDTENVGTFNFSTVTGDVLYNTTVIGDYTVTEGATYTLSISHTVGGTTNPLAGDHVYAETTPVDVLASASNGYVFSHWELDGNVDTANPITVSMDADHVLHGVFTTEILPEYGEWFNPPVIQPNVFHPVVVI